MAVAIRLHNIHKVFKDAPGKVVPVIAGITLDIEEGEFFILVGASGCGKSTLLRIMSGLEKEYTGQVTYGAGLTKHDMSFVFQQFAIMPWLTVAENIRFSLLSRNLSKAEVAHRVSREIHRLGLEHFAHAYPHELSGGMRQRVGIARALATDPKIIFMDEAFSELDSFTADQLRREFLGIWQEHKPTIVMVTHIIEEAIELADRIAVLSARPATVVHIVSNHITRPRPRRSDEVFALEDELRRLIAPDA